MSKDRREYSTCQETTDHAAWSSDNSIMQLTYMYTIHSALYDELSTSPCIGPDATLETPITYNLSTTRASVTLTRYIYFIHLS